MADLIEEERERRKDRALAGAWDAFKDPSSPLWWCLAPEIKAEFRRVVETTFRTYCDDEPFDLFRYPDDHGPDLVTGAGDLEQTLILEVALPDYYAEDYRLDRDEVMAVALRLTAGVEGDADLTPEQLGEACLEDSGETAGGFVRLSILTGSKDGNELQRLDGFIIGARVVARTPDHDRERDERLTDLEVDWVRAEARRLGDHGC